MIIIISAVLATLVLSSPVQPERIEKAVASGDIATLREVRRELVESMDEASDSADRGDYTLAYVDWRLALLHPVDGVDKRIEKENEKIRETLLEEAQELLEDAVERDPEDAESHALLGTIHGARISSMWSGMRRGPKADRALERASELAPTNPRVEFQMGVGAFFKPGMFGGGDDKARAHLERALELFAAEPASAPWPNWGHVDAWIWLGRVHVEQKEYDRARAAYEKAFELSPEHAYVRDELLPQLERLAQSGSR